MRQDGFFFNLQVGSPYAESPAGNAAVRVTDSRNESLTNKGGWYYEDTWIL